MANVGEILKVLFGKDLMFTNDLKVGKSGDYLTWDETRRSARRSTGAS
jgi:hypothetical protein